MYIPYTYLPDSNFQVSEDEARDYLDTHTYRYQREESRGLYYCTFPIKPSAADTAYVGEEIAALSNDLGNSSEDSLFVSLQSDAARPYRRFRIDELPDPISEQMDSLSVGQVIGPLLQKGKYIAYKISAIEEDSAEAYMRASHILVKPEDDTDEAQKKANEKAKEVLEKLRKGADFKDMAVEHSLDPSAANGGDLKWFSKGDMVAPFEEAAFSATKKGLLPSVVDSEFGSHIIKVTELPISKIFVVSTLEREVIARDESRDNAYQKSVEFLSLCRDTASCIAAADTMGLSMLREPKLLAKSTRIGRLSGIRPIIQWLFNEAEIGSVSEIHELSDAFFIGVMSAEQKKGLASYSSIDEELRTKVMNQLRARQVIDSLKHKTQDKDLSLDEISQLFPSGQAYVYSMSRLRFSSRSLRGVGNEPTALGVAFGLKKVGDRSAATAGEKGVFILELTSVEDNAKERDLEQSIEQLLNKEQGSLYQNLNKSIEYLGDIQDLRHKFY